MAVFHNIFNINVVFGLDESGVIVLVLVLVVVLVVVVFFLWLFPEDSESDALFLVEYLVLEKDMVFAGADVPDDLGLGLVNVSILAVIQVDIAFLLGVVQHSNVHSCQSTVLL